MSFKIIRMANTIEYLTYLRKVVWVVQYVIMDLIKRSNMNNICKYLALIINAIFLIICAFINPWFVLIGIIGSFIGMVISALLITHKIINASREELIEIGRDFMNRYDELQNKIKND